MAGLYFIMGNDAWTCIRIFIRTGSCPKTSGIGYPWFRIAVFSEKLRRVYEYF